MKDCERSVQDRVSDHYEDKRYKLPYSKLYHTWWTRTLLSMAPVQGRVLDNGCGTGLLADFIDQSTTELTGLDFSTGMLTHAARRIDKVVCGDAMALPFADNSFDIAIGRSLLHHLPDPDQGLREMFRVLAPGGRVLLVDTNRSLLSSLPRWISNKGSHFSDDHKNLDAKEVRQSVQRLFLLEKFNYFGYLAYPLGFPDIINIGKWIPAPTRITKLLIGLDQIISRIPLIRTQSWGIMVSAQKPNKSKNPV